MRCESVWRNKRNKAVEEQPESEKEDVLENIKEWIEWNVSPIVVLSVTALLISILSATLSISRLIQYLITH